MEPKDVFKKGDGSHTIGYGRFLSICDRNGVNINQALEYIATIGGKLTWKTKACKSRMVVGIIYTKPKGGK